jgi:GTPase SAR1 family protein
MQIQLSIWDTAGQERFNSLVKMYYRDVQCGIVVFDVTNPRALARLSIWIQPLKEGAVEHAVFILIANKIDGERKVSTEQGYAFAKANGMMYAETSAITGQGVDAAFLSAVEELVKRAVDDRTLAVNQPIPEMDGRNKKTKESSSTTSISQIQFRTERPSSCC